eukprot:jgi/Tetstr1/428989/TSEL_018964.t1
MRLARKLASLDVFRKIPTDLTEATLSGASISIIAAFVITFLFGMELHGYLQTTTNTSIVVDQSEPGELLKINFNISFPAISCEFLTADVSDAIGTKRLNLTKTVRKFPLNPDLEIAGSPMIDKVMPEVDHEPMDDEPLPDVDITEPITASTFENTMLQYDIVVVNFYAPWCQWCQRLAPAWEAATKMIHDRHDEADGRIRFAKMDCTQEMNLCRSHHIQGFPTIRVFRKGHDEVKNAHGQLEHESYTGDRTISALAALGESLAQQAGQPHGRASHPLTKRVAKTGGCGMAGFVLVKKVPGTIIFNARAPGYSFDHATMNMSHVTHSFMFGSWLYGAKYRTMARMHPGGIESFWGDKMIKDQAFISTNDHSTHEHYLQVIHNTFRPLSGGKNSHADVYEYTVHSHTYTNAEEVPAAKFAYTLSPMQMIVEERRQPFYHFVTTVCAIIGGVFTVAGMLDSGVYAAASLAKKHELGKLT